MVQRIAPSQVQVPNQRRTIQQESETDGNASIGAEAVQAAKATGTEVLSEISLERTNKMLKQTHRAGSTLATLQGDSAAKARRISGQVGGIASKARIGVINAQAGLAVAKAVQTGSRDDVKNAVKSTIHAALNDMGLAAEALATRAPQALGRVTAQGKAGLGLFGIPSAALRAAQDVKHAAHTGNSRDVAQAMESVGGAATTTAQVATDSMKAASSAVQYSATKRAAAAAIKAADPTVTRSATRAASKAIAESVTQSAAGGATVRATRAAAQQAGKQVLSSPQVMRVAGSAAVKATANQTVKTLGRAAARFAPGVNVAIAGYDAAVAAKDLTDPKASTTRKIASVVTAAGSAAAATNIPIVSQVGAGISLVSGMVREFF